MGTVGENDNDISLCINDSQTNHVIFIDRNDKIYFMCIECFGCAGRHQLFESHTFGCYIRCPHI